MFVSGGTITSRAVLMSAIEAASIGQEVREQALNIQ